MLDFEVLNHYGSSDARLKELFTTKRPENFKSLPEEEQAKLERDLKFKEAMEKLIQDRLYESIYHNLKNFQLYSAIDLAWDSTPISKGAYPLMMYAQGKLNLGDCATSLEGAGFGKYVTKDASGKPQSIDMPKFYEVNVNLIRSILTRRLAAQSNKYANLWPYYKYEPRSTSTVAKLRADVISQRVDIIADQYDYKHHEVQVSRETLMYGHVVDFVRSSWEKEQQERRVTRPPGEETGEFKTKVVTVKEGVAFVNPHPSRVFWDNAYPLISLNTDTGVTWCGFWDIQRYRDVQHNPDYWNRDAVSYSANSAGLFSTYSQYFNQYYTTITPPNPERLNNDLTSGNDRQNNVGLYSSDTGDAAVIVANFFWKLIPKDWGVGNYPHPVWVRFLVGGDNTIFHAEILPSTPGAVCSYNENDSRQINISFAHELMGYQDQLTNLLSHLLLCLQADHIKVLIVDTGVATPEQIKAFKEQLKGSSAFTGTTVLEIDRKKLEELGVNNPDNIVKLVETKSAALDVIFRAIGQLLQMVERMAALSPQEQGQPAPREISATETNLIAGTTESVYGFISDAIDEYRAAKKRVVYESFMSLGDQDFKVPVMNRYPMSVIEAAGLKAEEGSDLPNVVNGLSLDKPAQYTITGTKDKLEHDYIFTTRDGAERPVNTQSANVLVQLLSTVLSMPPILGALRKDQLYEVVNEIFRQSGAGYDLKLEMEPGEDNRLGPDPNQIIAEISEVLDGLTKASEDNKVNIESIKQAIEPILRLMPQPEAGPAAAAA